MELTIDQEKAKELISDWYENYNDTDRKIFFLSGYAGTGKTFLVDHLIKELGLKDKDVAFGTPTGKAASVLIERGRLASTIHRLIYKPVEEEIEKEINGKTVKTKQISFVKVDNIPNYKLLVIDEVSMVDFTMLKDLLSFDIPILATGDQAQLPAINGTNKLLNEPDFTLTNIVRQSEEDPIIKIASLAREGREIPYGNYGSVLVLNRQTLKESDLDKLLLKADQVICGTNKTRKVLNDRIRSIKGIDIEKNPFPIKGDKVICTVNNWSIDLDKDGRFNLVNGTIGTVEESDIIDKTLSLGKLSFKPDFLDESTEDIVFDSSIFDKGEFRYDMHQKLYLMADETYRLKKYMTKKQENESSEDFKKRVMEYVLTEKNALTEFQLNRFEFSGAISCHKAQGSEWDRVLLFDESGVFKNNANNWLYTGITRAKKKLVIIR